MEAGQWDTLTDPEWTAVEQVVTQFRGPLLGGLLALQPTWYEGEMPIATVAGMRFMAYEDFVKKVPGSRRLPDPAEHERGVATGEPELDRARMVGVPVAVGASLDGPLTLVEGYTRCCAALRDHHVGLYDDQPMPMIVGVTPRIQEWRWW